ncbi:MAG: hypothetical protein ACRD2B_02305 [Terriglobia bacterium]
MKRNLTMMLLLVADVLEDVCAIVYRPVRGLEHSKPLPVPRLTPLGYSLAPAGWRATGEYRLPLLGRARMFEPAFGWAALKPQGGSSGVRDSEYTAGSVGRMSKLQRLPAGRLATPSPQGRPRLAWRDMGY